MVIILKVDGQEVIVEHIYNDPGIMPVLSSKPVLTLRYDRVCIGIPVNFPVQHNALGHSLFILSIAIAFHKVPNEVTEGQFLMISGKIKMC